MVSMVVIRALAVVSASISSPLSAVDARSVVTRLAGTGTGVRRSAEIVGTTIRVSTVGSAQAVKILSDPRINRRVSIGKVSRHEGLKRPLLFCGPRRFPRAMCGLDLACQSGLFGHLARDPQLARVMRRLGLCVLPPGALPRAPSRDSQQGKEQPAHEIPGDHAGTRPDAPAASMVRTTAPHGFWSL
jgi:hypothetical protein